MSASAWTPVDETASKWTPVEEQPQAKPQGFWDRLKAEFNNNSLSDKAHISAKEVFNSQHPNPGSSEGANFTEALHDYDQASGGELAGGVIDIIHGNVAKGLHRIIGGASAAITPATPLMLPAMAAAPVKTALSIAGGVGGAQAGSAGVKAMGGTPDQQALAGDVGGIAGGVVAPEVPSLGKKIVGRALLLGKTPAEAYQSALKPSTTIPPEKVANIVQTGLENEIPVSENGIKKLSGLMDDLDDKVAAEIKGHPGRTVNPTDVAARADQIKGKFANQVNPTADMAAIDASQKEFLENNPQPIPAEAAQAMKQGTYAQLKGKAYGELKSASIEAQKALARGLKEELEGAFPELHNLNAELSKAYDLQPVLEKAVQRQANHQLAGIGTPIVAGAAKAVTGSSTIGGVAGLLKAIVDNPIVKSRLAISLNKAGVPWSAAQARIGAYSGALAASATADNPSDHTNQ